MPEFTCNACLYSIVTSSSLNSQLYETCLDDLENPTLISSNLGYLFNTLAYNIQNNLLFAIDLASRNLIAIESDGTTTDYGNIPELFGVSISGAAADENGYLFISSSPSNVFFVMDITPSSPTFKQFLDPTNGYAPITSPPYAITTGATYTATDWAYIDGQLFFVDAAAGEVKSLDPTNPSVITTYTQSPDSDTLLTPNTAYSIGDGCLYTGTGTIQKICFDGNTYTAEVIGTSPVPGGTDGAACIGAAAPSLVPIPCEPIGYRVVVPQGANNSQFTHLNLITGQTTLINPDIGLYLNAIGYNTLDQLIYGIQNSSTNLIVMDAEGTINDYGPIPNLPLSSSYNTGTADTSGHLFIKQGNTPYYYTVDIDTTSPNFGQLVDPTMNYSLAAAPYYTSFTGPDLITGDWVYQPLDGMLYSAAGDDVLAGDTVYRIDPESGIVTALTTTGLDGKGYGAQYLLGEFLYAVDIENGTVYRIAISGDSAVAEVFSSEIPSTQNDGTSCPLASLAIDFGDAPDTDPNAQGPGNYRTLLASNGPRHGLISQLTLGSLVTAENDGYQSVDALGDDALLNVQDDGPAILPLIDLPLDAASYTINERVTNDTGQPANLYAWIDFNKNGVFEAEESFSTIVPSSPGVQIVPITFTVPNNITLGETYVRVRLTTQDLVNENLSGEDLRSYGPAVDGEVEDYKLNISGPIIDPLKSVSSTEVITGQTLTYTLSFTNTGNWPAENVLISDLLPLGTSLVPDSVTANVGFALADPQLTIALNAPVAANDTVSISYQVLVEPNAPQILTNQAAVHFNYTTSDTIPPIDIVQDSNLVSVNVLQFSAELIKSADRSLVSPGDIVTYTLMFNNTSQYTLSSAVIRDPLPPELAFVEGSVSIDGTPDALASIITGITLPSIAPNDSVMITFQAKVIQDTAETIENISNAVIFTNINDLEYISTIDSNEVVLNLYDPQLMIVKTASEEHVSLGDLITYHITLSNTGQLPLNSILFYDTLPDCVTLVDGSFKVNDLVINNVDLAAGVNVGSLLPGESLHISYDVKVTSGNCCGFIENSAYAEYFYVLPDQTAGTGKTPTAATIITLDLSMFHQTSLSFPFTIPSCKPDAEDIDYICSNIQFDHYYVIDTIQTQSHESQILTGKTLVIHGTITAALSYTSLTPSGSEHCASFDIPFSQCMALPGDYIYGQPLSLSGIVEDIQAELLSCRDGVITLVLLITAGSAQ